MEVSNELDLRICKDDVAFKKDINKFLLSRWNSNRKMIIDSSTADHLKLLNQRGRKSKKHNTLFCVIVKFRHTQSNVNMVSYNWILTQANKL